MNPTNPSRTAINLRPTTAAGGVFALALLFFASSALAQPPEHQLHLAGVLNDYSPSTVKGGPWEMHGQWSVDLDLRRNSADFYADMTMSDYDTTNGAPDGTKGGQGAHTHHIRLTNVKLVDNMTGCPTYSPATTMGFQFTGTVSLITGNGGPAPFETTPPTSTLQVCVTGGNEVSYSNMSMVFGGPATTHFGSQAIHGVVRHVSVDPPGNGHNDR